MSRNLVVVGLVGLLVGAGAVALVLPLLFPTHIHVPGPGSPVRVSGGSITLISKDGWSCDAGTPDSCTKLSTSLPPKHDTPVQVSNVQAGAQGNAIDVTYPAAILGTWSVKVTTRDSNGSQHGVSLTSGDSTATAAVLNGSDHFEQDGKNWKYKSATKGCGNCELIKAITMDTGSSADPWYCNDNGGKCYVYIGTMH